MKKFFCVLTICLLSVLSLCGCQAVTNKNSNTNQTAPTMSFEKFTQIINLNSDKGWAFDNEFSTEELKFINKHLNDIGAVGSIERAISALQNKDENLFVGIYKFKNSADVEKAVEKRNLAFDKEMFFRKYGNIVIFSNIENSLKMFD